MRDFFILYSRYLLYSLDGSQLLDERFGLGGVIYHHRYVAREEAIL